jgi:hypothetical protein
VVRALESDHAVTFALTAYDFPPLAIQCLAKLFNFTATRVGWLVECQADAFRVAFYVLGDGSNLLRRSVHAVLAERFS